MEISELLCSCRSFLFHVKLTTMSSKIIDVTVAVQLIVAGLLSWMAELIAVVALRLVAVG